VGALSALQGGVEGDLVDSRERAADRATGLGGLSGPLEPHGIEALDLATDGQRDLRDGRRAVLLARLDEDTS